MRYSKKHINSDTQNSKQDQGVPNRVISLSRGMKILWLQTIVFVLLDAILVSLAWKSAYSVSSDLVGTYVNQPACSLPILLTTLSSIAAANLYGNREARCQFLNLVKSLTFAQVILLLVVFLYQPESIFSRSTFVLAWLFNLIFVSAGRLTLEAIIIVICRQSTLTRKIFLVGTSKDTLVAKIALKLVSNKEYEILGEIDLSTKENCDRWPDILEYISEQEVGEIFVCSWRSIPDHMEFYWSLKTADIHLRILPFSLSIPAQIPKIEMISGMPTIHLSPPAIVGVDYWVKRSFDLVVSSLFLLLTAPVLLSIAILIKLDSPGPIIDKQTRVGLRGEQFQIWKFRTTVINANQLLQEREGKNETRGDVPWETAKGSQITKVGKFLQLYNIDRLPQLINVVKGDMSLVGPRPLRPKDIKNLKPHHFTLQNVLPGMTGLWQVSGRSHILKFENAFRLDMTYINNWSLALDCQILLKTVKVFLTQEKA
ncbi:MAG: sugar transferase [Cyanobacteriota bacterium]|nr:sugar transferase [Cyanobacteriota bacterium]